MCDPEQRAEILKQYAALLPKLRSPEVRARMIADDRDPEAVLKWLTGLKDAVVAADEAAEKAVDYLLQATADLADANYEVFKALPQAIQELKQAKPLDPQIEVLEDYFEALAEQMPKEPEE
jgi:hypothetical protein